MGKKLLHVIAEFDSPGSLMTAVKKAREAGIEHLDTYTPFPVHGMDDAMGLKMSRLPWLVLCGGAAGLLGGFGLQTWVAVSAYPIIVSGKPLFSSYAFVPVTFELMVLFSAFACVFGMFKLIGLPKLYNPLLGSSNFTRVTSDAFILGVDMTHKNANKETTLKVLNELGGQNIEEIYE
mgnify:CR=1 FL=1|tara:strand:- start:479 stop:1012 length:534 start_codon:yes stop_codon:yes gene_type:complete